MINKYFTVWLLLVVLSLSYLALVYNKHCLRSNDEDMFNKASVLSCPIIKVNYNGDDISVCAVNIFNNKYKIMSYFNVGYGKCIDNFNVINRYFNEIENNVQASFFHLGINNESDLFMLKYIASHNRINL